MLMSDRCNLTVKERRHPNNGRESRTLLSMPLGLLPAVL